MNQSVRSLLLLFFFLMLFSCEKKVSLPVVETSDPVNISYTSSSVGGNVVSDGGAEISSRGLCWNNTGNPTIDDSLAPGGTGSGPFSKELADLKPSTQYYVRAYAVNKAGLSYGNEVSFTTEVMHLPEIITYSPVFLSANSFLSGGLIAEPEPYFSITESGLCLSTSPSPTIESMTIKYESQIYTLNFWLEVNGLSPGAIYYLRAYAKNAAGITYGNEIKLNFINDLSAVTDYDGNTYRTIKIGDQYWIDKNLRTTHFNDGTPLENVKNGFTDKFVPAYAWYNNDKTTYNDPYGCLYNYDATVRTVGKNICPFGWHVPDEKDWSKLISFLGGENVAGGKLKETGTLHWQNANAGATDDVSFSALPGGITDFDNSFSSVGLTGYFWSTANIFDPADNQVTVHAVYYNNNSINKLEATRHHGYSVRCVRDF